MGLGMLKQDGAHSQGMIAAVLNKKGVSLEVGLPSRHTIPGVPAVPL